MCTVFKKKVYRPNKKFAKTAPQICVFFCADHMIEKPLAQWYEEQVLEWTMAQGHAVVMDTPADLQCFLGKLAVYLEAMRFYTQHYMFAPTREHELERLSSSKIWYLDVHVPLTHHFKETMAICLSLARRPPQANFGEVNGNIVIKFDHVKTEPLADLLAEFSKMNVE